MEGLCANLLISNDIIFPKSMIINLGKKTALIGACRVTIDMNAKQRGQFLASKLLTSHDSIISPRSEAMISFVKLLFPDDRDFLFHPTPKANLTLYFYIMDYKTSKVLVRNASDLPLHIPCRHKLGHLLDIAYENSFLTNIRSIYDTASVPPSFPLPNLGVRPALPPIDTSMETVFENGIRMFGNADTVKQISDLVVEYSSI